MTFEEDVVRWALDNQWNKPHEGHTLTYPALKWDHDPGYSYSEYTQEDPQDSVTVTGLCSCGQRVEVYHTFYGDDLVDFLNAVSRKETS